VHMKAMITGGTGFLGRKLAEALVKQGHEVRLFARNPKKEAGLQNLPLSFVTGDLSDPASLDRACEGMDWVFHTAGVISYNPAKADLMVRTNVLGTKAVAEAALRAGVK